MAVISDRRWVDWAQKDGALFIDGEIKSISPSQRAEAIGWIQA